MGGFYRRKDFDHAGGKILGRAVEWLERTTARTQRQGIHQYNTETRCTNPACLRCRDTEDAADLRHEQASSSHAGWLPRKHTSFDLPMQMKTPEVASIRGEHWSPNTPFQFISNVSSHIHTAFGRCPENCTGYSSGSHILHLPRAWVAIFTFFNNLKLRCCLSCDHRNACPNSFAPRQTHILHTSRILLE